MNRKEDGEKTDKLDYKGLEEMVGVLKRGADGDERWLLPSYRP